MKATTLFCGHQLKMQMNRRIGLKGIAKSLRQIGLLQEPTQILFGIRLGILINAIGTSHAVKQLQTKIKAVQLGWMSPSS